MTPKEHSVKFRGGELTHAEVEQRIEDYYNYSPESVVKFHYYLAGGHFPTPKIGPQANSIGYRKLLIQGADDARRAALNAIKQSDVYLPFFLGELEKAGVSVRRLQKKIKEKRSWALKNIELYHRLNKSSITAILYWSKAFSKSLPTLFPPIAPQYGFEEVFADFQIHVIGGIPVPLRKIKYKIVIWGLPVLNIGFIHFPHLPGWNPPPKVLVGSPPVTVGGRTITAVDTLGPHSGNPVLPASGGGVVPPVFFNGYMKLIYTTGVAAGCRIEYATIAISQKYMRLPGGAWIDLVPGGSGVPFADPPGGGPNIHVGDVWVFSDFPSTSSFPPGVPVCTYLVRDARYRTWVREVCPGGATTILGFWDWSFRQILHQGVAGTESVVNPPVGGGALPGGAPPGGWPAAPGSGPTTWTGAGAATPADNAQRVGVLGW